MRLNNRPGNGLSPCPFLLIVTRASSLSATILLGFPDLLTRRCFEQRSSDNPSGISNCTSIFRLRVCNSTSPSKRDIEPAVHVYSKRELSLLIESLEWQVKWKVAPLPSSPLAQIRPPCDSTIDLLTAKLMPLPCGLVVKNASNICSALPWVTLVSGTRS
jgi:hypothetical protein